MTGRCLRVRCKGVSICVCHGSVHLRFDHRPLQDLLVGCYRRVDKALYALWQGNNTAICNGTLAGTSRFSWSVCALLRRSLGRGLLVQPVEGHPPRNRHVVSTWLVRMQLPSTWKVMSRGSVEGIVNVPMGVCVASPPTGWRYSGASPRQSLNLRAAEADHDQKPSACSIPLASPAASHNGGLVALQRRNTDRTLVAHGLHSPLLVSHGVNRHHAAIHISVDNNSGRAVILWDLPSTLRWFQDQALISCRHSTLQTASCDRRASCRSRSHLPFAPGASRPANASSAQYKLQPN